MSFIDNLKKETFSKLYLKQWVLGFVQGDIKEVIRTKTFNYDITWLPVSSDRFYGDPFPIRSAGGNVSIFFEDFGLEDHYGNISVMTLDKDFRKVDQKVLLDTKSHLSYPFIFHENSQVYVFPEAAHSGKLSCYEYIEEKQSLDFVKDIIDLPLLDTNILKYNGIYWLFGTLNDKRSGYRLHVYTSENLLGPYFPHPSNPVKLGLNGTRSAGHFIDVDGTIYRPTQNCERTYGESITINKIIKLTENEILEEAYMTISVDDYNLEVHGIHNIHTINALDDIIVVDGLKWIFSLKDQWKNFVRNRKLENQSGIQNGS